jgi:hypothetical protein
MNHKITTGLACLLILAGGNALADPVILETFTGYPDNALISTGPSGPALGLLGDWQLDAESYFYVNRTQVDLEAGTGKAVYDFPYDNNGAREAFRYTSSDHVLFSEDGDTFYASFLIQPARSTGYMLFTLILDRLDGGGQPEVSFGMKDGHFVVGNGGMEVDVSGGVPAVAEMLVVLKVEYVNNGNEIVTLWVDPENELSDPVIDNAPVDFLNAGGGKVTAVAIRGDQMDGQPAFFDDLRVGPQFADVTYDMQQPVLSRDIGLNGVFYDDDNPGHGFNFIVHELGFTVYYYGHTSNGERLWLVSEVLTDDLQFGVPYEMKMYEVTDGVFGQPAPPETLWGTISITMTDCDSGHASFNGLDGDLEMDLVRLIGLPGLDCQY